MCSHTLTKYTQKPSDVKKLAYGTSEEYPVNIDAVWGSLSTESCHSHLEELCCLMDIPPMDYRKFHKIKENLADVSIYIDMNICFLILLREYICWHDNMIEEFAEAGKEEAKIASENGNIDDDGIPYITVYLDGGWSKRSCGHNYDAASGSAVIIGKATKKVLFMGVRNKFCYVCAAAHHKKKSAGDHRCYRNWNATSTSMEADIIVEGFNKSINMHVVRYKYFIADGDSSTFPNLRTKVPYGPSIMKTECKNHVIKNYSKHLYNLKNDKSIQTNKFLTIASIKKLVDVAKYQIHHNKSHGSLESLRDDLANGPYHVFGDHTKCVDYYCQKDGLNLVEEMKSCALFQRVEGKYMIL
ncbi:hypothetical protein RN001_008925 [Aquatica leii]|uniref:Mutator-like transposase domain-containing protein n=1 Tax=Aquatica leii TaxID=1421715 RepID=A0AAN7PAY6_9COLE|nr:hypothetical protein RN001_008925 [Aquatica leii]